MPISYNFIYFSLFSAWFFLSKATVTWWEVGGGGGRGGGGGGGIDRTQGYIEDLFLVT